MFYTNSRGPCPAGSVPYTVQAGDTLYRIAVSYNSTVQDIIDANPGIRPNFLRVGQQICVPLKIQLYPSCPTTNYYVVRAGDTLASIAQYFNVTPEQLLYSNYGIIPEDLYVDQVLCIPVAPSPVRLEINVGRRGITVYRNGNVFKSYPFSLQNPDIPLPRGTFSILNKQVDPGIEVGARWIGLSAPELGIHGTNTPEFVEVYSSGQSIILTNQDISELFNLVPVGTSVNVL